MKKYQVYATVVGGKYIGEFEAESEEAAIEMAEQSEAAQISLCHHCSEEVEDPQAEDFTAEEAD